MYLAIETVYDRDTVGEGDGRKYACALDPHTLRQS